MTIAESILTVMLVANVIMSFFERRAAVAERQRLLSAVVARTPQEFVGLEKAAQTPPIRIPRAVEPVVPPIGL